MSSPAADALTALADKAATLADEMVAGHRPRDWATCPEVADVVEMADLLLAAGRMLPTAVVEMRRRAEAMGR